MATNKSADKTKASANSSTQTTKTAVSLPSPSSPKAPDPVELSRKLSEIAMKSQKIAADFMEKNAAQMQQPAMPDFTHISKAFTEAAGHMLSDPARLWQMQLQFMGDYMNLWQNSFLRFWGGEAQPVVETPKGDRRFKDPLWQESAVFDFIKQSYLLSANWIQNTAGSIEGLDEKTAHKVQFYTKQFVDAMSPSNFLYTNPEVLRATLESGGDNLLQGLENLLEDLERGKGRLHISMTDYDAFEVGKNLAVTAGKVVFQNDLMQLIQYEPLTKDVAKTPLMIIPPWINKYYILDLRADNSFVKWAVEQGQTVFLLSWVNPDEKTGNKTFEDYMFEGPMAALDAIEKATGEKEVNAIGYCLGGTLLAGMLSYMTAKKDTRIKSATYFTTMVDFSEAGDLEVFIDEEQIQALEQKMQHRGYLEGHEMATTFNLLRANDLIWSFVVNNYLLGKEPFPFDLLYWNSDSTRMPAAMHSFYLRKMYQQNLLVQAGGITLDGVPIDLTTIKTPSFLLSTAEDHIAPWKSTYAATQLYKGDITFVLSGSGHIAGVVNPPAKQKYCYWTNNKLPVSPDDWFKDTKRTDGSWWPEWMKWLDKYAGGKVPARAVGSGKLKALEAAPGSFVKVRAV